MVPKIKQLLFLLLFTSALSITFLSSCSTPTDPKLLPTLTLTVNGVNSTEVFIKLSTNNVTLPASVSLSRNNKQINSFTLITADTTIVDEGLNPNQSYTYLASIQSSNHTAVKSEAVIATTMDTTSHNFTWHTFTFGDAGAGSSTLYDVAIISANDIWAVGEIYMNDSTGKPDPTRYNLAVWDGNNWSIKHIPYNYQGQPFYHPIQSIFAFNENDIWFCGNGVIRWDGTKFIEVPIPSTVWGSYQMNKIWGNSSNDLYIVGNGSNIAHYNGTGWQKIESGTDKRLTDIYGTSDNRNIWACGWDNNHTQGIIIDLTNNTPNIIWDGNTNNGDYFGLINTLWSDGSEFWLAGGFVFRQSTLFSDKGHFVRITTENGSGLFDPGNFGLSIRGTAKNNIFLAGDLGMLWHYNGKSWYKYEELYNSTFDRRLFGLDVKDNLLVAVGWKDSNAWIIMGKK